MKKSEEVPTAPTSTSVDENSTIDPELIELEFMTQVVEAIEVRRRAIKPSSFRSSKAKAR